MTLRFRLLLSALLLSISTTAVLAWILKSSWQQAEETRFEQSFQAALRELDQELKNKASAINQQLKPLCQHDPILDSALAGLEGGSLNSRLLSLKAKTMILNAQPSA